MLYLKASRNFHNYNLCTMNVMARGILILETQFWEQRAFICTFSILWISWIFIALTDYLSDRKQITGFILQRWSSKLDAQSKSSRFMFFMIIVNYNGTMWSVDYPTDNLLRQQIFCWLHIRNAYTYKQADSKSAG